MTLMWLCAVSWWHLVIPSKDFSQATLNKAQEDTSENRILHSVSCQIWKVYGRNRSWCMSQGSYKPYCWKLAGTSTRLEMKRWHSWCKLKTIRCFFVDFFCWFESNVRSAPHSPCHRSPVFSQFFHIATVEKYGNDILWNCLQLFACWNVCIHTFPQSNPRKPQACLSLACKISTTSSWYP